MPDALVDGRPADGVPVDDRGLLYGDGLFETIAFHSGTAPLWPLHMDRLRRGAEALAIPLPAPALLERECEELAGGHGRCVVRLALTRGSGGQAYFPPDEPAPRRILLRRPFPADAVRQRSEGLRMITARQRLEGAIAGGGWKHLNRLPQVLVAAEVRRAGADEAVVLDARGRLVEALAGNLVIVRGDRLLVPRSHGAAVSGVGLAWLRERAGEGVEEADLTRESLRSDDAIWVINSVAGIRPAAALDGRKHPAGAPLERWQQHWLHDIESPGNR